MLAKTTFFSSQTPIRSTYLDIISPCHSFFSPNFIPKLGNIAPNLDLSHIPSLTLGQSSNKRLDLSDLGNPVQKKVKYNPEVLLYSSLPSQVLQVSLTNYGVKPVINKKCNSSVEFSVPAVKRRETRTQEIVKPRLLNCFEIPQNKKPVQMKKLIDDSLQTSEQLQHALEILKQKIFNTTQLSTNVQQQFTKPQRPELVVNTARAGFGFDMSNYDQLNLVKNPEVCYTGSPLSTTEDSANSCSTSDLGESEKMSPLWSNLSDLEPANAIQPQLNFLSFNSLEQEALVMKPNNLSNWNNNPQYTLVKSHTEVKKTQVMPSNDAKSDISETSVGQNHQAEIPSLCSNPGLFRPRRCLKLKWNPSSMQEDKLNEYFDNLQEILKCTINPEKAIKLLKECDNEPLRVYNRVLGKEKEFAREFLIRPRRRP